ncbi:Golgi pH regulator [Candida viswanathii]|uniref:Golgi pH regulator n=1 Tax=Candida viswanathii TaxID=5486 RepID=A0A367XQR0_9ASCO|nr:Golgi pH regulator [Candida viswanathii]
MSLLSGVPYFFVVLVVFIWSYAFIFNKNLLQKYSTHLHIPKNQINDYIEKNLTSLKLIRVQIDDSEEEDEYKAVRQRPHHDPNEELRNNVIGFIFSSTMALSVGLIMLILLELGNLLDADSRLGLFKFTINTLMLLLVMVLPISILSLLTVQDGLPRTGKSVGLIVGLYIFWLVILHKCGDLTQSFNTGSRNFIEKIINQVSIVGITILAILSGVGSTSTPYKIFEKYKLVNPDDRDVGDLDINTAIQYFNNTSTLLVKRQQELDKLQMATGGTIYNMPKDDDDDSAGTLSAPKRLSLLHRVQSFANIPTRNTEETELTNEIESLKSLRNSLYNDLVKAISRYHDQNLEQNIRLEQILEWANWGLAVYCVYRIINVFLIKLPILYIYGEDDYTIQSEVIDSGEEKSISRDALAITLSKVILTIFYNLPVSESQLVNQLSFILSASLFVCSFSNVLTTFKSFSKFFPGHLGSTTTKNWLKYLVVAELVGVYVIATALLIRTNLPANLSNQISQILSLSGSSVQGANSAIKEVVFIDNWFDKIFAITCVVSGFVLVAKRLLDEDRLNTGVSSYDEELFIEGNGGAFKLA